MCSFFLSSKARLVSPMYIASQLLQGQFFNKFLTIFQQIIYQQIFGTAMGSPVSVVVANMVMENIESNALNTFDRPIKTWKRYVDDTFVILQCQYVNDFFEHINNIESSICFTMEKENNDTLNFLDIVIKRFNKKLTFNVFRKPTHSDRYLNFRSNHPIQHKRSVVRSLMYRANNLISHPKDKLKEIKHIRRVLTENSYPLWLINENYNAKQKNTTPDKNNIRGQMILPYYPNFSDRLKCCLRQHNIRLIHKPTRNIGNVFNKHKKVKIDKISTAGVVYGIPCNNCAANCNIHRRNQTCFQR